MTDEATEPGLEGLTKTEEDALWRMIWALQEHVRVKEGTLSDSLELSRIEGGLSADEATKETMLLSTLIVNTPRSLALVQLQSEARAAAEEDGETQEGVQ